MLLRLTLSWLVLFWEWSARSSTSWADRKSDTHSADIMTRECMRVIIDLCESEKMVWSRSKNWNWVCDCETDLHHVHRVYCFFLETSTNQSTGQARPRPRPRAFFSISSPDLRQYVTGLLLGDLWNMILISPSFRFALVWVWHACIPACGCVERHVNKSFENTNMTNMIVNS